MLLNIILFYTILTTKLIKKKKKTILYFVDDQCLTIIFILNIFDELIRKCLSFKNKVYFHETR